jgi:hypothetical protein
MSNRILILLQNLSYWWTKEKQEWLYFVSPAQRLAHNAGSDFDESHISQPILYITESHHNFHHVVFLVDKFHRRFWTANCKFVQTIAMQIQLQKNPLIGSR